MLTSIFSRVLAGVVLLAGREKIQDQWDAAAAGKVPIHSGTTDASPFGIALSTTAATVSENYGRCHENAARLEALQEWVRAQHEAGVISK
jgi:hypothetical protein